MKKLLSLLLIICSIGVAYADDKSTVTSLKYVTDELNTRQDKFGANDGKAMTFTNTAGGNLPRDVKASLGTSTSDSGLPTVSAVNTGLENKQDEIGAVNTNTVVTYTGTPGTLGQKGIYQDTGTYAAQSDNLIKASTFNAALRNGLNNEFVCAGTDDGTPNGNCWLWSIDNETDETITVPGKNLFTGTYLLGNISAEQSKIIDSGVFYSFYIPCEPNTTYTVSKAKTSRFSLAWTKTKPAKNVTVYNAIQDNNATSLTITTGAEATYLCGTVWYRTADSSTISLADLLATVQVEEGPTATDYEPYGKTVNVYIPQNQSAQNQ